MDSTVVIDAIVPDSLETLRTTIRKNTSKLIFRRVGNVVLKTPIETVYHYVPKEYAKGIAEGTPSSIIYYPGTEPEFTQEQYTKNVEKKYREFHFTTTDVAMRENDRFGPVNIFGVSGKYSQIDLFNNMDFRFSYEKQDRMNYIPPRVGDLVCGLVDPVSISSAKNPEGSSSPAFKFWFTCSEQFLHTWTAINYGDHESLDKMVKSSTSTISEHEAEIRKALFRGNRLSTNTYKKWLRALKENELPFDHSEAENRYFTLRCERAAIQWVHVYAALVLMVRYREIPNDSNIPRVLDGSPSPKTWDLPEGWVDRMVKKYKLEQAKEERRVFVSHPKPTRATASVKIPPRVVTVPAPHTPNNSPSSPTIDSYISESMVRKFGNSRTSEEAKKRESVKRPVVYKIFVKLPKRQKIEGEEFPPLFDTNKQVASAPLGDWADADDENNVAEEKPENGTTKNEVVEDDLKDQSFLPGKDDFIVIDTVEDNQEEEDGDNAQEEENGNDQEGEDAHHDEGNTQDAKILDESIVEDEEEETD